MADFINLYYELDRFVQKTLFDGFRGDVRNQIDSLVSSLLSEVNIVDDQKKNIFITDVDRVVYAAQKQTKHLEYMKGHVKRDTLDGVEYESIGSRINKINLSIDSLCNVQGLIDYQNQYAECSGDRIVYEDYSAVYKYLSVRERSKLSEESLKIVKEYLDVYRKHLPRVRDEIQRDVFSKSNTRGNIYIKYVICRIGLIYYQLTGKKYTVKQPSADKDDNEGLKKEDYPFLSLVHYVASVNKDAEVKYTAGNIRQYVNLANQLKQKSNKKDGGGLSVFDCPIKDTMNN